MRGRELKRCQLPRRTSVGCCLMQTHTSRRAPKTFGKNRSWLACCKDTSNKQHFDENAARAAADESATSGVFFQGSAN